MDIEKVMGDFAMKGLCGARSVAVGFSGGRDSVALLDALCLAVSKHGLPVLVVAVHVHHGLSEKADDWASFCADFAAKRGVGFVLEKVELTGGQRIGVEAEARMKRFQRILAVEPDAVILGHHMDDLGETVLMNLARGTGVHGAAGFAKESLMRSPSGVMVPILRPLTGVSREDVNAYCEKRGLGWVEDESNATNDYSRNFVRNEIIPRLSSRFPSAVENMARSAAQFAEAAELLDAVADADLSDAMSNDGASLDVASLVGLGRSRLKNALRRLIRAVGGANPYQGSTDEICLQMESNEGGRTTFKAGSATLSVFAGCLRVEPEAKAQGPIVPAAGVNAFGSGSVVATETQGAGIGAKWLSGAVLSQRAGGERIRVRPGMTRELKKIMQEKGVLPWERSAAPCLIKGDRLLWSPFAGYADDCKAVGTERGFVFEWKPAPTTGVLELLESGGVFSLMQKKPAPSPTVKS